MTTKVFEAYKRGDYKPDIRYSIELFHPIWIKQAISYDYSPYYRIVDNKSNFLIINDMNIIKIEFEYDNIVYTFKEELSFWNHDKKCPFFKNFGNKTIKVNYKNIKSFH